MNVQVKQVKVGNKTYVQGYTPFTANNKEFVFPSFRLGEMPHLDVYKRQILNQPNGKFLRVLRPGMQAELHGDQRLSRQETECWFTYKNI